MRVNSNSEVEASEVFVNLSMDVSQEVSVAKRLTRDWLYPCSKKNIKLWTEILKEPVLGTNNGQWVVIVILNRNGI